MAQTDESWDRRKEDEELRKQTLKTLGAVQESIRLFERAINEHKVDTEERIDMLHETIKDHSKILTGDSEHDGWNLQLREMRRAINMLMSGVLGEGGNYDKSLKGQTESVARRLDQVQATQLKQELSLNSLENQKRDRITLRGQNLIVVAACCGMLGAVTAATINAYKEPIKAAAAHSWGWVAHGGKVSTLPIGWIKPAPVPKKRFRKKTRYVAPAIEEVSEPQPDPEPQPEPDTSKPTPAPLNPY